MSMTSFVPKKRRLNQASKEHQKENETIFDEVLIEFQVQIKVKRFLVGLQLYTSM